MIRIVVKLSLFLAAFLALSGVSACSKCSVPTYGALASGTLACNDKPAVR
jgi:hypothetical protein